MAYIKASLRSHIADAHFEDQLLLVITRFDLNRQLLSRKKQVQILYFEFSMECHNYLKYCCYVSFFFII